MALRTPLFYVTILATLCIKGLTCPSVSGSAGRSASISGTTRSNFNKYLMHVACRSGSILLCRHRDTLCTSGFMNDVITHNGPYGAGDASRAWDQSDSPGGSTGAIAESDIYDCLVVRLYQMWTRKPSIEVAPTMHFSNILSRPVNTRVSSIDGFNRLPYSFTLPNLCLLFNHDRPCRQ